MASYDYKCKSCDFEKTFFHSMKENPEYVCSECSGEMVKMIPKNMNFMLKGTNWSGKNAKEKNYRENRRKEMGRKMAKSHDIPQIQPNYKGEVVDSWETAKKLAVKDGYDAKTYEDKVDNLKKQEKAVEIKKQKLIRGDG
jgi:putative FmdB family regulatory protein